jgi:hypothetical protein
MGLKTRVVEREPFPVAAGHPGQVVTELEHFRTALHARLTPGCRPSSIVVFAF